MTRKVVYLPEVTRDFTDAFAYYEALSPQAALRFDEAFNQAEAEVEAGMITHQRAFEHYHRIFVGSYPYTLYYRLDGSDRGHALRPIVARANSGDLASAWLSKSKRTCCGIGGQAD